MSNSWKTEKKKRITWLNTEHPVAKDAEVRAAVEHIERQLEVAKKSWAEYQERARVAEVKKSLYSVST